MAFAYTQNEISLDFNYRRNTNKTELLNFNFWKKNLWRSTPLLLLLLLLVFLLILLANRDLVLVVALVVASFTETARVVRLIRMLAFRSF